MNDVKLLSVFSAGGHNSSVKIKLSLSVPLQYLRVAIKVVKNITVDKYTVETKKILATLYKTKSGILSFLKNHFLFSSTFNGHKFYQSVNLQIMVFLDSLFPFYSVFLTDIDGKC